METNIQQMKDGSVLVTLDSECDREAILLRLVGKHNAHVTAYGDSGGIIRCQFLTNDADDPIAGYPKK